MTAPLIDPSARSRPLLLLLMLFLFQGLIILGMFVYAALPHWRGTPMLLEVQPRDPRDLMRGQYVELRYAFSNLCLDTLDHDLSEGSEWYYGDELFVVLRQAGDRWVPAALRRARPQSGERFMRVRVAQHVKYRPKASTAPQEISDFAFFAPPTTHCLRLLGGIEEFYTHPGLAQQAEAQLRQRPETDSLGSTSPPLLARVVVDPGGRARVQELVFPE